MILRLTNRPRMFMLCSMNSHPTTAEPDAAADQRAEDAQYYRRALHEMIDVGVAMIREVHQQALPQNGAALLGLDDTGAAPAMDRFSAYERLSRSVRRSIMLARLVCEPVVVRDTRAVVQDRVEARRHIIRKVEDTIARMESEAEGGALHAELLERMDGPDMDEAIDNRPVA
jgi:hypothetical protein